MLNTIERTTATPTNIKENTGYTAKTKVSAGIKVTVHIPKNIPERVRQQKIDRIYDILKPSDFAE